MIGEGKHGLWRIQDNGHIREVGAFPCHIHTQKSRPSSVL